MTIADHTMSCAFLRIVQVDTKELVGVRMSMSFASDRTPELWQTFMPLRRSIPNPVGGDLYAVQVYGDAITPQGVNPEVVFDKWACVEAVHNQPLPEPIESFLLEGGWYAVFLHRGDSLTAAQSFRYIFQEWLPSSGYRFENFRPQFEVLGERYKRQDPASEEEIWIPVRAI